MPNLYQSKNSSSPQPHRPPRRHDHQTLPTSRMFSNLRYARDNLSHSSLLLHQTALDQQTPSDELIDDSVDSATVPLTYKASTLSAAIVPAAIAAATATATATAGLPTSATAIRLPQRGTPTCSVAPPPLPPKHERSYGLHNAHMSVGISAGHSTILPHDYSLCDSCRPLRFQNHLAHSSHSGSPVALRNFDSTRFLSYSPHLGGRRLGNANPLVTPAQASASTLTQQTATTTASATSYQFAARAYHHISRFQPRRANSAAMSQAGDDFHSPSYLSWRKLQLSRAKLKASSKTSALLSGFAMVAMVEMQINTPTNVPNSMLVAFAICTTLLVAVHMLALMISTCILPNIETVCNLHSISLVHESPHERLHWYIETAWAFSTLLGLILFLIEIAILCWVKFYDISKTAAWSACVVLLPVLVIFLAFAIHFYRSLMTHKYEVTVSGIRELEILQEQMEQEHHHTLHRNGINYGAGGEIV